jgi:hypothetical protein
MPPRAFWMLCDPIAGRIFFFIRQVRDQKRCTFGGVGSWCSIFDRWGVIRWYLVSFLRSIITLCPIVFCTMVADWQVPVALRIAASESQYCGEGTTNLEIVKPASITPWDPPVSWCW